jgi:hypothetical protein
MQAKSFRELYLEARLLHCGFGLTRGHKLPPTVTVQGSAVARAWKEGFYFVVGTRHLNVVEMESSKMATRGRKQKACFLK